MKITSEFLASSVNVNSVVVRQVLQQLKKANIVSVFRGSDGTTISKDYNDISLLEIYLVTIDMIIYLNIKKILIKNVSRTKYSKGIR